MFQSAIDSRGSWHSAIVQCDTAFRAVDRPLEQEIAALQDRIPEVSAEGDQLEDFGSGEIKMARPERFELPTYWFVASRSIQLS